MKHNPTASEIFEATRSGVLERIVAAQEQQIADLKAALTNSVQRERCARKRLYSQEGSQLVKTAREQEETTHG